jgi:hypothetical protein
MILLKISAFLSGAIIFWMVMDTLFNDGTFFTNDNYILILLGMLITLPLYLVIIHPNRVKPRIFYVIGKDGIKKPMGLIEDIPHSKFEISPKNGLFKEFPLILFENQNGIGYIVCDNSILDVCDATEDEVIVRIEFIDYEKWINVNFDPDIYRIDTVKDIPKEIMLSVSLL